MRALIRIALVATAVGLSPLLGRAQNLTMPEVGAGVLPEGEGREIVAVACTQCHSLTPIVGMRDGPIGWQRHVHNMVLRGAQLNEKQIAVLLNYLISNFGPGQPLPSAKPVTLPAGPGKELVETRCVLCHDLERVTIVKRDNWPAIVSDMYARFGLSHPEEQAAVAAYLAANYGTE